MSNLYKSFSIVSRDKRIIDYNKVIQEKIEHIRKETAKKKVDADGFVEGLDAHVVEALVDENPMNVVTQDGENESAEGNGEDNKNDAGKQADKLAVARETAASIVSNARQEAERIIEEAKAQAQDMKTAAVESGTNEGRAVANEELEKQKKALSDEFAARKEKLENEYNELYEKMEPELVDTITQLFVKAIHVIGEDSSQLVIDLINNAMHNMDMGNSFIIRVSPDDYPFVTNHQGKIYCAMSKDITIDIFEDSSLEKNQCKIESEFGVYDCSLDIQMDNLIKEIKLMSSLKD